MAAHVYWRLNVTANNGSANLSIAEVGMFTANAASTSTSGGTPSASTTNGTQTASLAFDGSTSTYWQATTNTGTLQYQFASAVDIASYQVSARGDASNPTQAPKTWTLQYSDDGSTWTTADTVDRQQNWGLGETRYYTTGANSGNTELGHRLNAQGPLGVQTTPAAGNQIMLGKAPPTATRTVSGTVKVNGVLTSGLLVRVYAKATGEFLGQANSAVTTGAYTINCGAYFNDVEVIAFDPTTFQALIYDQVTPQ